MKQTWKRQPRIPGLKRDKIVSCILPAVLDGLEEIAASEGRSLSWVIHQPHRRSVPGGRGDGRVSQSAQSCEDQETEVREEWRGEMRGEYGWQRARVARLERQMAHMRETIAALLANAPDSPLLPACRKAFVSARQRADLWRGLAARAAQREGRL